MSSAPGKIDLRADWEKACIKFLNTTERDPREQPVPSIDDVIRMVTDTAGRSAKKHEKADRIKDVLAKTMTCVMKFGSIIGTAASMAFPPSSMCVNAVSFLFDAGKAYANIFSSLDTLFSRVLEALKRSNLYMKNQQDIPPEMAQIAHDILMRFMSICELSYKVLKKNAVLQILKTLAFNDDAGVGAELTSLEQLVADETSMGVAIAVINTGAIRRELATGMAKQEEGMRKIEENLQKSKDESTTKKQLEVIEGNLNISGDTYSEEYKRLSSSLLEGSGDWTAVEPDIVAWTNAQTRDVTTLFLVAEQGYGKTHSFTRVLKDLREHYKQGLETPDRISVAYHYLDREKRASEASTAAKKPTTSSRATRPLVDTILRTWAYQIAVNDPVYRKDLYSSYTQRSGESDNLEQLKARLFLSHAASSATFFLLLDGTDTLIDAEEAEIGDQVPLLRQALKDLLTLNSDTLTIKVLLTGGLKVLDLVTEETPIQPATIEITSKNRGDIERYIDSRIKKIDVFSGTEGQALGKELRTTLVEKLGGNFDYADYLLKRIAREQRPSEIRKIVESAKFGERSSDALGNDIRRLNEILDPVGDIPDLNVLLLWVLHACKPLTIKQLKAIIRLHQREVVLKFFNQVRDRFNLFFVVSSTKEDEDATVELAPGIAEYFKKETQLQEVNASINEEIITEREVRLVKKFLHTFCDTTLYERMGFDDFFQKKQSNVGNVIKVPDSDRAHAEITLHLLMAINGGIRGEAECMMTYAASHLKTHLSKVGDLSLIDPILKRSIGSQLYDFLTGIQSAKNFGSEFYWVWYDDGLYNEVLRFLKDGAVKKNLSEEQNNWIMDRIGSDAQPENNLFDTMATHLTRELIEDEETDMFKFASLIGYINKTEHDKDSSVKRLTEMPFPLSDIPTDTIYSIAVWAFDQVDVETAKSRGKLFVGKIFRMCKKHEEALQTLEEARQAIDNKMAVDVEIAEVWAVEKEWHKAITILAPVVEACESGVQVYPGEQTDRVRRYLAILGGWYDEAGMHEEAIATYLRLLKDDLSNYGYVEDALVLYLRQNRFDELTALIMRMDEERDTEEPEKSRLEAMIVGLEVESQAHLTLFKAARESSKLDFLHQRYDGLINMYRERYRKQHGDVSSSWRTYTIIKAAYAVAIHKCCDAAAEKEKAEKLMLEVIELKSEKYLDPYAAHLVRIMQGKCFYQLLEAYGERAASTKDQSMELKETIEQAKELRNNVLSDDIEDYSFDAADARSALGRLFSKLDLWEEAREELRANVGVGVALLSDEDPANDHIGYLKLGHALMKYGDIKNSIAAWRMIGPTAGTDAYPSKLTPANDTKSAEGSTSKAEDDEGTQPSSSASGSEAIASDESQSTPLVPTHSISTMALNKPKGPLWMFCDGECDTVWTYSDNFNICRDCANTQFCTSCNEKLLEGSLKQERCKKSHEFMNVPPWDPERSKKLGTNNVQVDDEVLPLGEWLDRIRKDWDLQKDGSPNKTAGEFGEH